MKLANNYFLLSGEERDALNNMPEKEYWELQLKQAEKEVAYIKERLHEID